MFRRFGFIFAILYVLYIRGETAEFCQSFAKNGYQIDYSFVYHYNTIEEFVLIIDQNYWRLRHSKDQNITFVSFESKSSDLLGKQYDMSFKIIWGYLTETSTYSVQYYIGLYRSDRNAVNWAKYANHTFEESDKAVKEMNDVFKPNIKYSIAFGFAHNVTDLLGCLQQTLNETNKKYKNVFHYYEPNITENKMIEYNQPLPQSLVKLRNITNTLKVMGIFDTQNKNLEFLILFASDSVIKYCFTAKRCLKVDLHELVDCGEEELVLYVWVFAFVILFILVLICIMSCLTIRKVCKKELIPKSTKNTSKVESTLASNANSSAVQRSTTTGSAVSKNISQK